MGRRVHFCLHRSGEGYKTQHGTPWPHRGWARVKEDIMATAFEELVNGMVNIGFGVAATAAEKGREVLEDLNAKGEEVRHDPSTPDFARSMSDVFESAGGMFTDATERLGAKGETAAECVLDELILARVRCLNEFERSAFVAHVQDLVRAVESETVHIPVESVDKDAEGDAGAETETVEQGEGE